MVAWHRTKWVEDNNTLILLPGNNHSTPPPYYAVENILLEVTMALTRRSVEDMTVVVTFVSSPRVVA